MRLVLFLSPQTPTLRLVSVNRYCEFVAGVQGGYDAYVRAMEREGTWGDHVTLQAAADRLAVPIYLVTSYADPCPIHVAPRSASTARALWLSFFAEVHYNSVVEAKPP